MLSPDQLEAINQSGTAELPPGSLDLGRIGLFGHSAGAATAAEACRQDSRCQAALLLDGTLVFDILEILPDGSLVLNDQPFPRPMMQINSGLLYDLPRYQGGYAPNRAAFENATQPAYNLVFDQASHLNLTDLSLILARPVFNLFSDPQMKTGPIDPELCMQTLNAYTLAFFDQYLKGQPSSLSRALLRTTPSSASNPIADRAYSHYLGMWLAETGASEARPCFLDFPFCLWCFRTARITAYQTREQNDRALRHG